MRRVEALLTGAAPEDWMERLDQLPDTDIGAVVLINSALVHGTVHIESAVEHAERAFSRGTNRSRDLAVETILYLAGERRIDKALEMSRPGESNVVVAIDTGATDVLKALGTAGEEIPAMTDGTLEALERTALLDLEK